MLKTLFYHDNQVFYDGSQLAPGWIEKRFNLKGDSLVSFVGGCNVKFEHMVDLKDFEEKNFIRSDLMLHFLGEFFSSNDLYFSFALQRLLVLLAKETLEEMSLKKLNREGDDLYYFKRGEKGKLSISVATVSSVSSLFHFALNLKKTGTPVKVATMKDLGVEAYEFAPLLLKKFSFEYQNLIEESKRVRRRD